MLIVIQINEYKKQNYEQYKKGVKNNTKQLPHKISKIQQGLCAYLVKSTKAIQKKDNFSVVYLVQSKFKCLNQQKNNHCPK